MGAVTAGVIAGGAMIGNAYVQGQASKRAAQAQRDALDRASGIIGGVRIPTVEEQQINLENSNLVGEYTPEQMMALGLDPSAMEQISTNPELAQTQMDSLNKMNEIAQQGGLSEGDRAAYREMQRTIANEAQARQNAILSNMAERGTLGSGQELAARMNSSQEDINRLSRGGDSLTRDAQARALQALSQSGSMASSMRGQEFGEQSQVASAKDAINKFNLANQQQIASQNTMERNSAQLRNLQAKQAIEDARIAAANQTQMHNKGLLQQNFNNRMGIANSQAGFAGQAGAVNAQAQRDRGAMIGGVLSGVGNIAGAYAGGANSAKPTQSTQVAGQMPANNYQYDPNKVYG